MRKSTGAASAAQRSSECPSAGNDSQATGVSVDGDAKGSVGSKRGLTARPSFTFGASQLPSISSSHASGFLTVGSAVSRSSSGSDGSSAACTRTAPLFSTDTERRSESCAASGDSSRALHTVPLALIEGTSTVQCSEGTSAFGECARCIPQNGVSLHLRNSWSRNASEEAARASVSVLRIAD